MDCSSWARNFLQMYTLFRHKPVHTRTSTYAVKLYAPAFTGKNVTAVLARNFLESTTVWWLPSTVVGLTSFALSVLWGVVLYLVLLGPAGWAAALVVAVICGLVVGVVLHLCGSVLLDIVDTVYLVSTDLGLWTVSLWGRGLCPS